MPREIKTTLAVDGEAAFKRAINEANTSIRNMGTQLTLAQAQFKKDGDAMKLMETRSKALKGEIGQQEEIVKALEKAVEDSTKAYGENSAKTEKWEAELNRAKARLVSLQNELTLNEAGLDRNGKAFDDSSQHAADYQATLQTIGKNVSFETVSKGIDGITGKIGSAVKTVLNFANTIRETFADAGEWADELMMNATKYGMDVETLQKWQNAADFIDTDVETIIGARDKMSKKMKGGWKNGDLDMWQVLGVDLSDEKTGQARDKMDVMWELGETLLHISEMQERGSTNMDAEALSMEVFGKSWRDLLPLFKAGREEWEKTVEEQNVVSEERVKALGELDDANQALENSWDVTKYSFLAELAPVITDVTEAVTKMLGAFNEWMDTDEGKQAMEDLSGAIRDLFAGLKDVQFADAISTVGKAIDGIKDGLIWLDENKDGIKTALEVIAAGFALLKVSQLAIDIGKIVSGSKGLLGIGGGGGTGGGSGTAGGGSGMLAGVGATVKNAFAMNGLSMLAPLGVLAAATAPAAIMQKLNEKNWTEKFENTETAAKLAEASGKDATLLRALNEASGPKANADGTYRRGLFGFLDMNPTEQANMILQSLGDERNRGMLYNNIMRYGPRNGAGDLATSSGNLAWNELMRYWGIGDGEKLDPQRIDALIEYLREMETNRLEESTKISESSLSMDEAVAEMKVNTENGQKVADTVAGADIKKFNGLPANMQDAVRRGAASGVSGIRVYIDGQAAGRLLAPYVNNELGGLAQ